MSHTPSVVIAVQDIHAAIKDVEAAGGKILGSMDQNGPTDGPKMIPGVGMWVSFMDTENNRVSMLQPLSM